MAVLPEPHPSWPPSDSQNPQPLDAPDTHCRQTQASAPPPEAGHCRLVERAQGLAAVHRNLTRGNCQGKDVWQDHTGEESLSLLQPPPLPTC